MITGAESFREALKSGVDFLGLSCTGTMASWGEGLDFSAAWERREDEGGAIAGGG